MIKKEIKVKLKHFHGEYLNDSEYYEKHFPIKVLKDNFNVKFIDDEKEADVVCEACTWHSDYKFLTDRTKKIILFVGEDLFKKRNLFNLIEALVHRMGFGDKKWKIMDRIDSIIPSFISQIPIMYFLPKHVKFIKKIIRGEVKNAYAVVQNDLHGKSVFILPSFFYTLYDFMPKLIKEGNTSINDRKKFCAFIVSSNSCRERIKFFKQLSKYKKVDSYGRAQNNMGDEFFNRHWITNLQIYKNYKFVIGFENNFSKRYICEKLPNIMLSGAIPIFRGAPDIGDYFNKKSFINYDDYGSYKKMIKKIIELDKDDQKYQQMLKEPWFVNNKIPTIFKEKEKELIKFYQEILTK